MTAPDPAASVEQPPVADPAPEQTPDTPDAPVEPPSDDPEPQEGDEGDLPEWVRKKLDKANREAKNLRTRLKDQEPMVAAAQEAERAKMSELERANADLTAMRDQLASRDTELLQSRYGIPDDYVEFIGAGSFEEKEARAAKVGLMVQSAKQEDPSAPTTPPSQRPVESLRPGASPTPPPAVDNSYPANWGFQPPSQ